MLVTSVSVHAAHSSILADSSGLEAFHAVQSQGALKSNTGAFHPASFFFAGFFAGPTVTRYSFTVAFRVALL